MAGKDGEVPFHVVLLNEGEDVGGGSRRSTVLRRPARGAVGVRLRRRVAWKVLNFFWEVAVKRSGLEAGSVGTMSLALMVDFK